MNTSDDSKPFSIVVGYDTSECSREAITALARAALPDQGIAYVVSVAETADAAATIGYGNVTLAPSDISEYMRVLRDAASVSARDGAERLRQVLPGWTIDARAPEGSSYWSLIDFADRHQADLIVIGSHGRSALGRVMLGSTSQFVLAHASCSVRISRCGKLDSVHASRPPRVFAATDGSAHSDAMIDAICARPWPKDTQVRLFTAIELGLAAALESRAARSGGRTRPGTFGDLLLDGKARLEAHGLVVTTGFRLGNPKHAIVEEADQFRSDVIFIGAQGHSFLERLTIGSVSASIAARAECAVEVVRPRKITATATDHEQQTPAAAGTKREPVLAKEMSCS